MKNPLRILALRSKAEITKVTEMEDVPVGPVPGARQDITSTLLMLDKIMLDPKGSVEMMKEIVDLQERIFDKNAENAFNAAMVQCQIEMAPIVGDSHNKQTDSYYAKLEIITKAIKPIYTKHGFCLCFGEADCPKENWIRTVCEVSHIGGFSKKFHKDLPMDDAGIKGNVNKTPVHAAASTSSYGKRYVTVDIFNLPIVGADNDAQTPVVSAEDLDSIAAAKSIDDLQAIFSKLWKSNSDKNFRRNLTNAKDIKKKELMNAG